jgi:hypothetical protein
VTHPDRNARRLVSPGAARGVLQAAGQRIRLYESLMQIKSDRQIEVFIPTAVKDLQVLPHCIDGVRRNVKHPIPRIYVVAPPSREIQDVCEQKECTFVDERHLLDMDLGKIDLVVNGVDRSGWIFQQFLKWSADGVTQSPQYLVVDADTVFIKPQVFERNGKTIFNYSDESHRPYFEMYRRLLGESVLLPVSFTSHQMLYDRKMLMELKARMEQIHQCGWKEAILRNLDRRELSGVSDYDTYGHFVLLHHPECMAIEYWWNLALRRKKNLVGVNWLRLKYGAKYKSISFHSYKETV